MTYDLAVHEAIQKLRDRVLTGEAESFPHEVEAARQSGGLPIYSTAGGTLVLMTDGSVSHWDPEDATVTNANERSVTLARVVAANRFEELESLLPDRPVGSPDCPTCGGEGALGRDDLRVYCGTCMGAGWVRVGAAAETDQG